MRNNALNLMKEQLETVTNDIQACELMMVECRDDPETCTALSTIQAKYEATADELETQIEKLR